MPRAVGQIDDRKTDAIVDAAAEVFAERGFAASLEEVARRAGVSKQTLYNRYGGKDALVRELVDRKRAVLSAPLEAPGAGERLEDTLADYALTLLRHYNTPAHAGLMRLTMSGASEHPELARTVYEHGPKAGRARMAEFLAAETRAGRLAVDDPLEAAEFFSGMAMGQTQIRNLLGVMEPKTDEQLQKRARSCARRFLRAYAP